MKRATKPLAKRATRTRPMPRWVLSASDLDEMAKRRCLLVLSVLSGERAVTEVIAEAQISRPMYYQLEERALRAMLVALTPGANDPGASEPAKRIAELERRLEVAEQGRRRSERLLLLTRKVMKGPLKKLAPGRPPKGGSSASSKSGGRRRSHVSPKKKVSEKPSTPTPDGGTGP